MKLTFNTWIVIEVLDEDDQLYTFELEDTECKTGIFDTLADAVRHINSISLWGPIINLENAQEELREHIESEAKQQSTHPKITQFRLYSQAERLTKSLLDSLQHDTLTATEFKRREALYKKSRERTSRRYKTYEEAPKISSDNE